MTAPWWDGRLAGFDLETTSPNPEVARIVTSSVVKVGGGLPVESFSQIVNPGVDIPDEAAAIHGISNERAQAEGADPGQAIGELLDVLLALIEAGLPLNIFNARYDLTVMDREARRWDMEPISAHPMLRVIDPRVIDGHVERYRPGKRTLGATSEFWLPGAKRLGDAAHDADADALTAVRLGFRMCAFGTVVRRARDRHEEAELLQLSEEWHTVRFDLDLLHAKQVEWAEVQARGLEEHLQRKGTPKLVDYDWPVVLPGRRREGSEGAARGLPPFRSARDIAGDEAHSPGGDSPSVPLVEDLEAAKAALFETNLRPAAD